MNKKDLINELKEYKSVLIHDLKVEQDTKTAQVLTNVILSIEDILQRAKNDKKTSNKKSMRDRQHAF